MWELNADCGPGETKPSLWKQMQQEDAWHIIQRAWTNTYGNRSISLPDIMNFYCQPSQVIMVWPCLPLRYPAKNHTIGNMVFVAEEEIKERRNQRMDRPVIVVVAAHRRRQKLMGDHCRGRICLSTPTMIGSHGCELKYIGRDISYSFVVSVSRPKVKRHQTFKLNCGRLVKEFMAVAQLRDH